jgi:hypothetical protein
MGVMVKCPVLEWKSELPSFIAVGAIDFSSLMYAHFTRLSDRHPQYAHAGTQQSQGHKV